MVVLPLNDGGAVSSDWNDEAPRVGGRLRKMSRDLGGVSTNQARRAVPHITVKRESRAPQGKPQWCALEPL